MLLLKKLINFHCFSIKTNKCLVRMSRKLLTAGIEKTGAQDIKPIVLTGSLRLLLLMFLQVHRPQSLSISLYILLIISYSFNKNSTFIPRTMVPGFMNRRLRKKPIHQSQNQVNNTKNIPLI